MLCFIRIIRQLRIGSHCLALGMQEVKVPFVLIENIGDHLLFTVPRQVIALTAFTNMNLKIG